MRLLTRHRGACRGIRRGSVAVATLALCIAAPVALAGSGVQPAPQGDRILVSKDLAGERWAITCEPDGTISGNVFRPGGGPPAFVWCTPKGNDGNSDPHARLYTLECFGADTCERAPCLDLDWASIATVSLPGSFCLPPKTESHPTPIPTLAPTRTPVPIRTPPPVSTPTPTPLRTPPPISTPAPACCRRCTTGKPCGDSCIAADRTCHQPPGCACYG